MRREQLGLGRKQLGRRMRLWLRMQQRRMRMLRRVQLRMQLQLRMQRLLLLSSRRNGTLRRPAFAARQRDRQPFTRAATSR